MKIFCGTRRSGVAPSGSRIRENSGGLVGEFGAPKAPDGTLWAPKAARVAPGGRRPKSGTQNISEYLQWHPWSPLHSGPLGTTGREGPSSNSQRKSIASLVTTGGRDGRYPTASANPLSLPASGARPDNSHRKILTTRRSSLRDHWITAMYFVSLRDPK